MEKIKVTAQQRANALEARDVMWPSVPEANVIEELCNWTEHQSDKTDCGTVACFGGWCARWPKFQDQGVYVDKRGVPRSNFEGPFAVSTLLFGDSLFTARSSGTDSRMGLYGFDGTDHELVTARLNWLIENSEVIS